MAHAEELPNYVIREGKADAAIVIRENPPRLLGLAALELQHYLEKMSGARLPIVHKPQSDRVNLFVGRSRFTDELGISDEGLAYGAFRMVSGPDWLALLGHDRDFLPPEPFQRDVSRAEAQEIWDAMTAEVTDSKWAGPPLSASLWNPRGAFRSLMAEQYGRREVGLLMTDRAPGWAGTGISRWDLGGSLNAVHRYLMSLGVRWYMPGSLGEVVPEHRSIALPAVDTTVHPDYGLRTFNWSHYPGQPVDNVMWALRIGMFSAAEVWPFSWAHNLPRVYSRDEMKQAHPELFALRGGVRDTEHRGKGSACFSSERLVQETVEYARFVFDHFDVPTVDLWPEDAYRSCQCELCAGKTDSELVWGFVDRVARQLHETHPDRLVTSAAYTPYTVPPDFIDRFTPNVRVMIASGVVRPQLDRPEKLEPFLSYVHSWQEKVAPGNILRWQNQFYNSADALTFPVIHPRAIAAELRAMRGTSRGEFHNWQRRAGEFHNPGNSHLTLYTLGQYLWDAGQDIETFLDEYYTLFYGPAREEMKAALEFAQTGYSRDGRRPDDVSAAVRAGFVERLHVARTRAGDTVYGERIQLAIDELPPLDELRRLAREEAQTSIDRHAAAPLLLGRDENGPSYALLLHWGGSETYGMRDQVSGEYPEITTHFEVWWDDGAVNFEIHANEPDMANLALTEDVRDGDSVVLLIETQVFSYYHIQIAPDGRVFERAFNPVAGMGEWRAQAEVETDRGADYWKVRVRLPVTGAAGLETDANHGLAGVQPNRSRPWFVNVGRTRVRGGEVEQVAFSPTGHGSIHDPDRFAFFVFGRPGR